MQSEGYKDEHGKRKRIIKIREVAVLSKTA